MFWYISGIALSKQLKPSKDFIKCDFKMDGWMTCDFVSFQTVFQSYQDDGPMIMKGCVQWNPVNG